MEILSFILGQKFLSGPGNLTLSVWHHSAILVMPNLRPLGQICLSVPQTHARNLYLVQKSKDSFSDETACMLLCLCRF